MVSATNILTCHDTAAFNRGEQVMSAPQTVVRGDQEPSLQQVGHSTWQESKIGHSPAHLLAGGSGGLATAIATAPLDVSRTRLQSSLYIVTNNNHSQPRRFLTLVKPYTNFANAIKSIHHAEGYRGFFVGLGPSMAGVVPATATKLYVYGTCKKTFACVAGMSEADPLVHAAAAMTAGVATATITNPIWLVKTRLQLDQGRIHPSGEPRRQYKHSLDCIRQVARKEGVAAFYRGLSASYVGSLETVVHLVLYEYFKKSLAEPVKKSDGRHWAASEASSWLSTTGAAGAAKAAAVMIAYPHEVVRTRMRQAPSGGQKADYSSFTRSLRTIWVAEGLSGLYGGLIPHVIRSIPSAMASLGVYEFVLGRLGHGR